MRGARLSPRAAQTQVSVAAQRHACSACDRRAVDLRLAVRAQPPLRLDRPAADATHGPQAATAGRADQEVVAHRRLAERAALFFGEALLHHPQLELALAHVVEVLGRADDRVDEQPERSEDESRQRGDRDDDPVVDASPRVLEHPVRAGQPHAIRKRRRAHDEVPRGRREEVADRLERVVVSPRPRCNVATLSSSAGRGALRAATRDREPDPPAPQRALGALRGAGLPGQRVQSYPRRSAVDRIEGVPVQRARRGPWGRRRPSAPAASRRRRRAASRTAARPSRAPSSRRAGAAGGPARPPRRARSRARRRRAVRRGSRRPRRRPTPPTSRSSRPRAVQAQS